MLGRMDVGKVGESDDELCKRLNESGEAEGMKDEVEEGTRAPVAAKCTARAQNLENGIYPMVRTHPVA